MSFTKRQRDAARIYQDIPPDVTVEADHIYPRSRGGTDDVANLQFLNPDANRMKSDHVVELRAWQKKFVKHWTNVQDKDFLCVAIPGGGKTIAALSVMQRFLSSASDRRVLIVAPTINLRRQWQVAAEQWFGIKLQTKEFGTNFKQGFTGGVATYSMMDTSADLFRKICATGPTLVVLDEPHHCGDMASWGTKARHAFELAEKRLLLSGTPFRTDGQPIPFVKYDGGGVCLPDFRYDYPDALKENIVRTLSFDYSQGSFEEIFKGAQRSMVFHGDISEEQAGECLRQILTPSGAFVTEMIRMSHARLMATRQSIPDAAAMAVCMDITHAQRVADIIRRETGCHPSIVVSDEEVATDNVDAFRYGRQPWLVSVRQVSEGTDIKRLQVLCYLTNSTTELIFRQLIGRVSRVRYQERETASEEATQADLEAFIFLPADPRLIAHAKNIEEAQLRALKEQPDEAVPSLSPSERVASSRLFLGSTHDGTEMVVIGGKSYTQDEKSRIDEIAVDVGITMAQAAKVFTRYGMSPQVSPPPMMAASGVLETEEERQDALRRTINQRAFRLSRLLKCDVRDIHKQWPRQQVMTTDALKVKLAKIVEMLVEASR